VTDRNLGRSFNIVSVHGTFISVKHNNFGQAVQAQRQALETSHLILDSMKEKSN